MTRDTTTKLVKAAVSRRRVLKGAGVAAAALAFPMVILPRKSRAGVTITIRDPGGPFEKAFTEAYINPFNEAMKGDITAVRVAGKHEPTAQIKAMVDTKSYEWDMALLSLAAHNLLRDAGYLEELKLGGTAYDEIKPEFKGPYFAGNDVYTAVIVYRHDVVKKPPASWADLWNVKDFPGRRSLRKHPFDTIEEALMADGVATNKVYPCDFDRAFKSLDKIKKDVVIWWDQGAQTSQMIKTGEVDMLPTWNGRAQVAIDEGAPATMEWNQGIAGIEGWCILKGGPNMDACRKFIAFAAQAERQAAFTPHVSYGPANPNAYKHIPAERAKVLPTNPEHLKKALLIDNDFWGKEKDKAIERFNAWLLQG